MNPDGQLPDRVERLEQQMAEVRERLAENTVDASAARVLSAGADRDVSEVRAELRAHTRVIQALRETQLEQGRVLDRHTMIQDEHGRVLGTLQGGVEQILRLLTPPQR